MAETGFTAFNTMVDKANKLLKDIEDAFGWPKSRRNQSYNALRAVLFPLRDRMSVEEAVEFGAQLPTLIRGVYYDGWKPERAPVKMDVDEFLRRVREHFPYSIEGTTEDLVHTVTEVVKNHITEGEWADVKAQMPPRLATVMA